MIVVDTNIVAYAFIEGDRTRDVLRLQRHDSDWRVPSLWRHEFLNILTLYVRQEALSLSGALRLWSDATLRLIPREHIVDMERALELAVRHQISAYDAQFIALAETLGVSCVTEDRKLLKAFPRIATSIAALTK